MKSTSALEQELIQHFGSLSAEQQRRVVDFARSLNAQTNRPKGHAPSSLRRWIGAIPAADLEQIRKAVEENCENVDSNGW